MRVLTRCTAFQMHWSEAGRKTAKRFQRLCLPKGDIQNTRRRAKRRMKKAAPFLKDDVKHAFVVHDSCVFCTAEAGVNAKKALRTITVVNDYNKR